MTKRCKPAEKQAKAKKSGVYSSVTPERTAIDSAQFTVEQNEACTEQRVKRGFVSNMDRIQELISSDCLLSDLDTVMGELPDSEGSVLPTAEYITTMDGRLKFACSDKNYSDEEEAAFKRGYRMGVEAAIGELSKSVGDKGLTDYAHATRNVIHAHMKTYRQRINFMEEMTPDELESRIVFYFDEYTKKRRPFTVPGLAYAVGFVCRQDLLLFIKEQQDTLMGYMLASALMKIMDQRNTEIISNGGGVMAGHELDMAMNFDWSDAGKEGEVVAQTTNNTDINQKNNKLAVTPDSLPPTLSLAQWQAQFLSDEKRKGNPVGDDAIDVVSTQAEFDAKVMSVIKGRGRPRKILS